MEIYICYCAMTALVPRKGTGLGEKKSNKQRCLHSPSSSHLICADFPIFSTHFIISDFTQQRLKEHPVHVRLCAQPKDDSNHNNTL